jgi:hypothetical protein
MPVSSRCSSSADRRLREAERLRRRKKAAGHDRGEHEDLFEVHRSSSHWRDDASKIDRLVHQPGTDLEKGSSEARTMNTKWNLDGTRSGINFAVRHMVVSKVAPPQV